MKLVSQTTPAPASGRSPPSHFYTSAHAGTWGNLSKQNIKVIILNLFTYLFIYFPQGRLRQVGLIGLHGKIKNKNLACDVCLLIWYFWEVHLFPRVRRRTKGNDWTRKNDQTLTMDKRLGSDLSPPPTPFFSTPELAFQNQPVRNWEELMVLLQREK